MPVFFFIMYLLALLCFIVAAFATTVPKRVDLTALGLAFFVVPALIQAAQDAL